MRRFPLFALLLALCLSNARAQEQQVPPTDADSGHAVASSDDPDAAESETTKVPLAEIRRYVGVFDAIRQAYVDPVDDHKLMQSAIKGLLLDLDPHSAYLEKQDAQAFDEETSGAYEGIGVEVVTLPDGSMKIVSAIDDTPAAQAGLRSGDTIVAVDGRDLTPADAAGPGPLRGKPGTSVKLKVVREGAAKPFEVTLKRDTIRLASVRGRMLEPGYGYIRISQFQTDTAADFEKTLDKLQAQAGGKLRGLVLDLRSNPGGLLTSAVQIADDLVDSGVIVSTRGRMRGNDATFRATPGDRMHGAPVVALVDAGSASATEVLSGALHDLHRAKIVGSRTFGKGLVQTLVPLDNGDAIKLTTARYYTPSGKSIQGVGIVPDVTLQPDKATADKEAEDGYTPYTEASLPGHLHGEDEDDAGTNAGDVLPGDAPITAALLELKKPVAKAAVQPKG
jgi:carboxyl-terminal processing protease